MGFEGKGFIVKGNCYKWVAPKEKCENILNLNREFYQFMLQSPKGKKFKITLLENIRKINLFINSLRWRFSIKNEIDDRLIEFN